MGLTCTISLRTSCQIIDHVVKAFTKLSVHQLLFLWHSNFFGTIWCGEIPHTVRWEHRLIPASTGQRRACKKNLINGIMSSEQISFQQCSIRCQTEIMWSVWPRNEVDKKPSLSFTPSIIEEVAFIVSTGTQVEISSTAPMLHLNVFNLCFVLALFKALAFIMFFFF